MAGKSLHTVLQTSMKDGMMTWAAEHPEERGAMLALALSDDPKLGWRAAWLLSDTMETDDPVVKPAADAIIRTIAQRNDGHQRELLKVLLRVNLDDDSAGHLYNLAVALWEAKDKTPSTRYYAFRVMVNTALRFPELGDEVKALTAFPYMQTLSPGIRRGVEKMMAELRGRRK